MRNGLLEFLGGTFLFTAITYATGKGYYNSYFRRINVEPSLIDLTIDQIFFEGGRQLVAIFTEYLLPVFLLVVFYLVLSLFVSLFVRKKADKYAEDILGKCSQFKGLLHMVFFVWFSNFAFNSAMKSGEDIGAKSKCLVVTVYSNEGKDKQIGCLVYKTVDNVWVKYPTKNGFNVSIFPRDNFYRVDAVVR